MIVVPRSLLPSGTVGNLATLVAGRFPGEFAAGELPKLAIDGYHLPSTEPLSRLIRDDDEILVFSEATANCVSQRPLAVTAPDGEQDRRMAELAAVAEARAKRLLVLEEQVEQLTEQLTVAVSADLEQALALPPKDPEASQHCDSASASAAPRHAWLPVDSVEELAPGDAVRYRLRLVDAWRGRQRRSSLREARIVRLQRDSPGAGDPQVVLRHANGSMDHLEASQLLDLVARRRLRRDPSNGVSASGGEGHGGSGDARASITAAVA